MSSQDRLQLKDDVNRTCRATAAMRALELLKNSQHAIIRDELAIHLAGDEAMERFGLYWDRSVSVSQLDPNRPQHNYFAGRSRILDDRITAILHSLLENTPHQHPVHCDANTTIGSKLQVVSLGCGLDTRPWRLEFPEADIAWFDVDQQPVLDLKETLLQQAGAQLHPEHHQQQQQHQHDDTDAAVTCNSTGPNRHSAGVIHHRSASRFCLKCSSYTMVAVDLSSSSWMQQLQSAGLQPSIPTLWVAEGLLYYLRPQEVTQLLNDISAVSPEGSTVVLATHVPSCNLEASRTAPEGMTLRGLFKSCIEDLQQDQLYKAGWGVVEISKDVGVILAEDYGTQVLYPYSLEYSSGKRLDGIESVLELVLANKQVGDA